MHKNFGKRVLTLLLVLVIIMMSAASIASAASHNGRWRENGVGWWYERADSTYPQSQWSKINNKWYYFNNRGYMETGWIKSSNKWYYLDKSGSMWTNSWVGGKYYVGSNGAMLTNSWTPDGYYVDSNGVYQKSQVQAEYSSLSSAVEAEVARLVNIEREKAGLKPLRLDSSLSNVARDKSKDLFVNNYFAHNSPTYGSPFDMMKSYGISFRTAGENIAARYHSAAQVMKAWMNSPGHKRNILNPAFDSIGVGYYQTNGPIPTGYWTQMFTGN